MNKNDKKFMRKEDFRDFFQSNVAHGIAKFCIERLLTFQLSSLLFCLTNERMTFRDYLLCTTHSVGIHTLSALCV